MNNFESTPPITPESSPIGILADVKGIKEQVEASPTHRRVPLIRLTGDAAAALRSEPGYENLVLSHREQGVDISLRKTGSGVMTLFAERYPPGDVQIIKNS